jgi:molecular chaperone Hsp33
VADFFSGYGTTKRMNDWLMKGHVKGLDLAFSLARTTKTVNEVVILHDCDPVAAHILGRALTGALLSAAILPETQRLNVCWKYQGILRTVLADAGSDGTVRAFISPPQLNLESDDSSALYGEIGNLQTVTSDPTGHILNSSTTPISLHDVAKDLAYAHCISDQVETGFSVMIGFNADPENPVNFCQGLMIQALPGTDLERFDRIRHRMDAPEFRKKMAVETGCEAILAELIQDEPGFAGFHQETCAAPRFFCPCNREKMEAVVRTLPIPERMELVQNQEPVKINCQFCNRHYELTIDECIAAWNRKT